MSLLELNSNLSATTTIGQAILDVSYTGSSVFSVNQPAPGTSAGNSYIVNVPPINLPNCVGIQVAGSNEGEALIATGSTVAGLTAAATLFGGITPNDFNTAFWSQSGSTRYAAVHGDGSVTVGPAGTPQNGVGSITASGPIVVALGQFPGLGAVVMGNSSGSVPAISVSTSNSSASGVLINNFGSNANLTLSGATGSGPLLELITGGVIQTVGTITGGSGYTNGTYTNVPLTCSTNAAGQGAVASVVTISGGAVTGVTLPSSGTGLGFNAGNSLTVPVSIIGNGVATLGTITGGSGFTNGTYTGKKLLGGNGSGAVGTIVVSGGAVTSVTITSAGVNYKAGDVVTAATTSIGGGAGVGFSVPVSTISSSSGFSVPVASATSSFPAALSQAGTGAVSLTTIKAVPMSFGTNGATGITISSSNIIQFNAYGAGTLSTNSSGVVSASDGRYKTKTRRVQAGIATIQRLAPTYFRWHEDTPFANEHEELGFIAQEVAAVIPEASPEPEQKGQFKNYHDRAIIAFLVKAMQELCERNEALEIRVKDLSTASRQQQVVEA
jgi:hypothetical protein